VNLVKVFSSRRFSAGSRGQVKLEVDALAKPLPVWVSKSSRWELVKNSYRDKEELRKEVSSDKSQGDQG